MSDAIFDELNDTEYGDVPHLFKTLSPEYTDIPDPEHFDTICEGALDTLKGMETLSTTYTKAQEYLFSCMSAADHIDYQQQRTGMEDGFFSAIGSGLSSAWEFIKKMFSAVWNAFFGGGDSTVESKAEKTEKKVKQNKDAVEALTKTGKPEEQVDKIRDKVKKKAEKVKKNPQASSTDKAKADNIIKKVDQGNVKPTSQKEMDIPGLLAAITEIDKDTKEALIKSVGSAEALRTKFTNYIKEDRSSGLGKGRMKELYLKFRAKIMASGFGTPISEIVKANTMTTALVAMRTQENLLKAVEEHVAMAKFIAAEKASFEAEVKALDEALKKKGKDSNKGEVNGEAFKNKGELKGRLSSANAALSIVNATAGFQTKMLEALERLSNAVDNIYGDYTDVVVVL